MVNIITKPIKRRAVLVNSVWLAEDAALTESNEQRIANCSLFLEKEWSAMYFKGLKEKAHIRELVRKRTGKSGYTGSF